MSAPAATAGTGPHAGRRLARGGAPPGRASHVLTLMHGRGGAPIAPAAIAIPLFEDLAVVPPLLLVAPAAGEAATMAGNLRAAGLGLVAIVLLGRQAFDPMFRTVARTRTPEPMTAGPWAW